MCAGEGVLLFPSTEQGQSRHLAATRAVGHPGSHSARAVSHETKGADRTEDVAAARYRPRFVDVLDARWDAAR